MSESTAEVEEFAFQHSSPLSLRQSSVLSSPAAPPLEDHKNFDYNIPEDPFDDAPDRRMSGRSSISSFPASVLHHDIERTPPRSLHLRHDSAGSYNKTPSPRRRFGSVFRNPSSVREMQLNDDTGEDTESVVSHRSHRSHGSAYSSPSKRSSRTKKGSGLKKEFPLVLLHCTLLPASSSHPGCDKDLYAAILPEPYRQRWVQLQEKLSSSELQSRGILIPHPQEEYELLEERLLEALELEKPRIQNSHYIDRADSGFESGGSDAEDKCPDCGKQRTSEKKWEIKIYAANGLMRGAAWSAAWRDMEKVDVELAMWMPEDIRQEVGARLDALRAAEEEANLQTPHEDPERQSYERAPPDSYESPTEPIPAFVVPPTPSFVEDRRNIAIVLLSIMVLVYAVLHAWTPRAEGPSSVVTANATVDTRVITSTEIWTTTVVADPPPSLTISHDVITTSSLVPEENSTDGAESLVESSKPPSVEPAIADVEQEHVEMSGREAAHELDVEA